MSRIGSKPVAIPKGVKVSVADGLMKVDGAKSKLSQAVPPMIEVTVEGEAAHVRRLNETRQARAMHGLARSLLANMVKGVTEGFKKNLEIVGVGYKAQLAGRVLNLSLGYSHPVNFNIPDGITVTVADNVKISVEGADKQMVGEVAATIRRFRKPEPYKGKGIRYAGEHIVMKEGKSIG